MFTRSRVIATVSLLLIALSGIVSAQSQPPSPEVGIGVRFLVSLLVLLVLGVAVAAIAPRYTSEVLHEIYDEPGLAFGWGLLVGVGGPIVLVLLALTVIGLLITIPGLIAITVLGIVGTAVSVVLIGDAILGRRGEGGVKAAVIGALVLAVPAAIPVLGNIVMWIVSAFGLGVVSKRLYRGWRSD